MPAFILLTIFGSCLHLKCHILTELGRNVSEHFTLLSLLLISIGIVGIFSCYHDLKERIKNK